MIGIREGPAAADRDEARIALFGEDHDDTRPLAFKAGENDEKSGFDAIGSTILEVLTMWRQLQILRFSDFVTLFE